MQYIVTILFLFVLITTIDGIIIGFKYKKDKYGTELPLPMDDGNLFDLLKKEFKFPDLKAVERNNQNKVVIYGNYGMYELTIKDNRVFVGRDSKPSFFSAIFGSRKSYYLEGEVVKTYLNKLLNPSATIEPYKKYDSFGKRRLVHKLPGLALILIFALVIFSDPSARRQTSESVNEVGKQVDSSLSEQSNDLYVNQVKEAHT